ncbi:F-box/kelch-repeat protein At3g23880-like [Impatiens glandulifera]|uniref:F-box/kelch-repeat protein At3g23880-like n=1 Tax=Impatiens glandulifera TaxID=253017 RepID=UPI001FB0E1E3|nr:F-box/kelch-repeat protein At3g23880-like [Impatiens glandulifera]
MEMKSDPTTDGKRNRRKTIHQSSTSVYFFTGSLSSDLISEIISRLPVKFLLQLRCVCKSWCSLISDPIFVKKHLKASTQNVDYAHHRFIMVNYTRPFTLRTYSLSSLFHEEFPNPDFLDYPLNDLDRLARIVGSVNGLLCLSIGYDNVFIWNPATRKSKRLPNYDSSKEFPRQYAVYGFGYDEDTADYNVVVITPRMIGFERQSDSKIFGLKSDSWRKIEDFPKDVPVIDARGVFVSGSLHWIAARNGEMEEDWRSTSILSFDMSKETYSEILQPPYAYGEETFIPVLGVLSGCLFLLLDFEEIKGDVWVMKEYGNVESWSKLFSIPYQDDPIYFNPCSPIYIFKKNELFLLLGFFMLLYNINNNTVTHPNFRTNLRTNLGIDTYVESLVSPCLEWCQFPTTD